MSAKDLVLSWLFVAILASLAMVGVGCSPHFHLFESPAGQLSPEQLEWQRRANDLLNEYDRRLEMLENAGANGERT